MLIVREREEAEDATFVVESTPSFLRRPPSCQHTQSAACISFVFLPPSRFNCIALATREIATVTIIPKIAACNAFRHGAIRTPPKPYHHQPITNSCNNRTRTPTGRAGNRDLSPFTTASFRPVTHCSRNHPYRSKRHTSFTGQDATIPAGNPPSYGQVTVAAHAIQSGSRGNIAAYDINEACCALSVLAKNTEPFPADKTSEHTPP